MLVPAGTQPNLRLQSAAIQNAADQFLALIEAEKIGIREAADKKQKKHEVDFADYKKQSSAALSAALARAATAHENLRASQDQLRAALAAQSAAAAALAMTQNDVALLSETLHMRDQQIRDLQQALAERDQLIATLHTRVYELERRSSGGESFRESGELEMQDDTVMNEFLNIDNYDPMVSIVSVSRKQC